MTRTTLNSVSSISPLKETDFCPYPHEDLSALCDAHGYSVMLYDGRLADVARGNTDDEQLGNLLTRLHVQHCAHVASGDTAPPLRRVPVLPVLLALPSSDAVLDSTIFDVVFGTQLIWQHHHYLAQSRRPLDQHEAPVGVEEVAFFVVAPKPGCGSDIAFLRKLGLAWIHRMTRLYRHSWSNSGPVQGGLALLQQHFAQQVLLSMRMFKWSEQKEAVDALAAFGASVSTSEVSKLYAFERSLTSKDCGDGIEESLEQTATGRVDIEKLGTWYILNRLRVHAAQLRNIKPDQLADLLRERPPWPDDNRHGWSRCRCGGSGGCGASGVLRGVPPPPLPPALAGRYEREGVKRA